MKKKANIILLLIVIFSLTSVAQSTHPVTPNDSFRHINKSTLFFDKRGTGQTPVVFVSGLGEDHSTWQIVQDSISVFMQTLSYDRCGLGQSDYHHESKKLSAMTSELNALINAVQLKKPFILIGHSLGCQIVKDYAAKYPRNVKAIIFIDPGYNEKLLKAKVTDSLWQLREAALRQYLPHFNEAQQEELRHANESAAITDTLKFRIQVPVILFTATRINPGFPCSRQEFLVKQSTHLLWLQSMPNAIHMYVPGSRHYIHTDEPSIVIDAARSLIGKP